MSELHEGREAGPEVLPGAPGKGQRAGPPKPTGREDIEFAVAASGLRIGDRVTMSGSITMLSADSGGAVWMRVHLDGERERHIDCWKANVCALLHKRPANLRNDSEGNEG